MDTHGAQLRFTFDSPSQTTSQTALQTLDHAPSPPQGRSLDPPRPPGQFWTEAGALLAPIFVRHPRAHRYVLRILPDGTPRVTIPRRGSRREAERFLLAQHAWIDRQRASLVERLGRRPSRTWLDGHTVLVRGAALAICQEAGRRDDVQVEAARLVVSTREPRGSGDLRAIVTSWLWRLARVELPARLRALARVHDLEVTAVSVRNQRARWGSCAPNGRISLNWRLIQTPDSVRDYVLLHELMHLRQANHSIRFWRLVAAACPDYQAARVWLRGHERLLLDA